MIGLGIVTDAGIENAAALCEAIAAFYDAVGARPAKITGAHGG